MDTAKGYTGQYADTLTGLDYYVSRYYDPVVSIFLSADDKEGNAQGMNPYAYVGGNPETMSDPSGEMVDCPDGCGGGGGGNNNQKYNDPNRCDSVCMEGVGGAGTELLYPGRPSWQQLAFGMIMYGYAAGELLIPWMVENAFYHDDFVVNGVVLDRAVAFGLALYVQGYRQEESDDVKPTNNLGAGFFYLTDQYGDLIMDDIQ
jgi:RHS repeat-associated protein